MLRHVACPEINRPGIWGHRQTVSLFHDDRPTRAATLDSWGLPRAAGDLLLADTNAFLLGCLFNYFVPYVKAFCAPLELRRRLGHLDVSRLAEMEWEDLAPFIGRGANGGALHRFPNNLAKRVVAASKRLTRKYECLASNVWPDGTRVGWSLSGFRVSTASARRSPT
jgi:hypothetical protein